MLMPALRPKFELRNKQRTTHDLASKEQLAKKPLSISIGRVNDFRKLSHEESFVGNFNILPSNAVQQFSPIAANLTAANSKGKRKLSDFEFSDF